MPFAGHPNIGTAFVLATLGNIFGRDVGDPLLFEEKAGAVRLDLLRQGTSVVGARLAAPQPLSRGVDIDAGTVAVACSVEPGDIEASNHAPCVASCGVPFVFAELKSRRALSAAHGRSDVFAEHLPSELTTGVFLYVREKSGDIDIHARMFAPRFGVPEDPATGSANLALAGLLADLRSEPGLMLNLRITQGVDMGRPSLLEAMAEKRDGRITGMWIGGRCVPMMEGKLEL